MIRRLTILATPTIAALALMAALAFPAAADSPYNSAQGSVKGPETGIRGDIVDVRAAFSAWSDAAFQATQGASGSAGGMINAQPNAETNPLVPDLGRVQISCLNVQGNVAVMTGTVSEPISTNEFTGAPWYRPANWWIVGAYLVVVDNGEAAPAQMFWGFFVNPDRNHVISTPRCFAGGLAPSVLLPVDEGHANVHSAAE
jgi:hypothetical protein